MSDDQKTKFEGQVRKRLPPDLLRMLYPCVFEGEVLRRCGTCGMGEANFVRRCAISQTDETCSRRKLPGGTQPDKLCQTCPTYVAGPFLSKR